jgi:hypothetical protein
MQSTLTKGILVGILIWLGLLTGILWKIPSSPILGVIDVQSLVMMRANQLASLYPNGEVPKAKLQDSVSSLKHALKDFTAQKSIILFHKTAVLNDDLKDYTEEVQNWLNLHEAIEEGA